MQLDEPIEVKIYEWNTGGLLTRIGAIKKLISLILLSLVINSCTIAVFQIRSNVSFTYISGG
jgi:small subunit ribosomal protein S1